MDIAENSLRASRPCTAAHIKATRSEAAKKFRMLVVENLEDRKLGDHSKDQNYTYTSRVSNKYEIMARWRSKGYKYLITHAERTLINTIKTPSSKEGTGKDTIEKWEDIVGPILEDICAYPWRGTEHEQRVAEAALISKVSGQTIAPHKVNVNRTVWASPLTGHEHAKRFPSLSHIGGTRTTTVFSTQSSSIFGFCGNSETSFALLLTLMNDGDGDIRLVCPVDLPPGAFLGTVCGKLYTSTDPNRHRVQGPNGIFLEPTLSRFWFLFSEPEGTEGNVQLGWDLIEDETFASYVGP